MRRLNSRLDDEKFLQGGETSPSISKGSTLSSGSLRGKFTFLLFFLLAQGASLPFGDEKSFGIGWSAKWLSSYSAHAKIGSIFRLLLFAMTRLNRGLARLAMSSLKTIVLFKTSKGN